VRAAPFHHTPAAFVGGGRRALPALCAVLLSTLLASTTAAQPATAPAASPPPPYRPPAPPIVPGMYDSQVFTEEDDDGGDYYGWQNFTAVGLSASVFATGILLAEDGDAGPVVMGFGIVGYVLGGPIIHWSHGYVGKGFASLALHLFIPASTTFVGALAGCSSGDGLSGCVVGTLIGWQIGIVIPPIIDGTALGWHAPQQDAAGARSRRSARPTWRLAPAVGPSTRGLAISGSF
jgi:hypothetical protein